MNNSFEKLLGQAGEGSAENIAGEALENVDMTPVELRFPDEEREQMINEHIGKGSTSEEAEARVVEEEKRKAALIELNRRGLDEIAA